jgi:16S rRNA (guanine966-N2)-methyltransferase
MPSLRITGGTLRGRRVPVPPREVRPTSERARQAYFNIVGPRIDGARFLDLFAGSGVFALEALSRGAVSATAIEKSRRQCEAISELAADLGVSVTTIAGDAVASLGRTGTFDLVYADPPYDYDAYDELLAALPTHLAEDALVAVEHRRNTRPFSSPAMRDVRRAEYGEVWVTFFVPMKDER